MKVAIIVAAGSGTRFGSQKPKQFVEIAGKPILIHTLERFENCAAIDEIILVLAAAEIEDFQKTAKKFNLNKLSEIVAGGASRAVSVLKGLEAIDADKAEIVVVHDGARPLVSVEEISKTIEKAREFGAACLVTDITDTIKRVENGKILATIDRGILRRALTPQAFRFEILKRAFAENEIGEIATDECFLVEKLGIEIVAVEGSAKNIKITTKEDFILAENLLKMQN